MFSTQGVLYEVVNGRVVLHAMPLLLAVLCVLAIAYRYYSAFLAARRVKEKAGNHRASRVGYQTSRLVLSSVGCSFAHM